MSGVPYVTAFLITLVLQLGRLVGFLQNRGRLILVAVQPAIVEYLKSAHLDRILDLCTTEDEALRFAANGAPADTTDTMPGPRPAG